MPSENVEKDNANNLSRGPLLFCLLLSFLLSINARDDQRSFVFSGVFAMIWIAEAVVTFQIKLLGGNMYVESKPSILLPTKLTLPLPAPSSNPSASSATRSSRSSSPPF